MPSSTWCTRRARPSGASPKASRSAWTDRGCTERISARELFELITRSTYDHGEPGIFFLDRVRAENNLAYCEDINACNPCAEQPLPAYGCCCLASINLTRFVDSPFGPDARFDFGRFADVGRTGVRMLDNVLDGTMWPLEKQREEAMNKRRIGLGVPGAGFGAGDASHTLRQR